MAPQTAKTGTHSTSALFIRLIKQSSRRCRQFQLQQSHLLSSLSVASAFAFAVALLIVCAAKDHLTAIQSIMFMRSTLPLFIMLRKRNIIPDLGHVPDPDQGLDQDQDLDLDPIAIDYKLF